MTPTVQIPSALSSYVQAITVDDPAGEPALPPYAVLPGLGAVLGFQHRGRLAVRGIAGTECLAVGGITGLQSEARWFVPDGPTRSLIVRFTAVGAYALMGGSMAELTDRHVPLAELAPGAADVAERIVDGDVSNATTIALDWLLALSENRGRRDAHLDVMSAVRQIASSNGTEPVERIAERIGVGRRQLERLFRDQVGVGPKEFASLARFTFTVRHIGKRQSWADVAAAAGYSDQAHFIRSFKRRAGVTPGEYERQLHSASGNPDLR